MPSTKKPASHDGDSASLGIARPRGRKASSGPDEIYAVLNEVATHPNFLGGYPYSRELKHIDKHKMWS